MTTTIYTVRIALLPISERTMKTVSGTLEELCEYFKNTLEMARSCKKSISLHPRSIEKLLGNLSKADMVLKGRPYYDYTLVEEQGVKEAPAEEVKADEPKTEAAAEVVTEKPSTTEKLTADQRFAQEIISMLQAGTAPWVRPWEQNEAFSPYYRNLISKKTYTGANIVRLAISSMAKGYSDPRWLTFKQASENGWIVRKGEHGTPISFYTRVVKKNRDEDDNADEVVRPRHALKTYVVFNASQVDGVEPLTKDLEMRWDPIEIGEKILSASHATIRHDGGNRAFYHPLTDEIHLPAKEQFPNAAGYYSTACHELAHWTGKAGRLDRNIENSFGTENYAKEELRAEIASWMLAVHTGLPFDPAEHTSYVAGWVKSIRNDHHEIFRACADAQKIVDFLLKDIVLEEVEA